MRSQRRWLLVAANLAGGEALAVKALDVANGPALAVTAAVGLAGWTGLALGVALERGLPLVRRRQTP